MSYEGYPTYAEYLTDMIEESGLSIGEIARKMQDEKGVKIDRSYISMLKNNKTKNPASDEINKAIADITGGNADKLIFAAYVEKAPQEMRGLLSSLGNIDYLLSSLVQPYFDYIIENNLLLSEKKQIDAINKSFEKYNEISIQDKIELLNTIVTFFKDRNLDSVEVLYNSLPKPTLEEQEEHKKEMRGYWRNELEILSLDTNKFYPPFKQEVKNLAKKHEVSIRIVATPQDVEDILVEKSAKVEFINELGELIRDATKRYISLSFTNPGFVKNVKIELDKWLESGTMTFAGITLSPNEKDLIKIYVEALIRDKITT